MAEQAQATDTGPRPIVPWLKLAPKPHLEGIKCEKCGGPMGVKQGRRGAFLGCLNYPNEAWPAGFPPGLGYD